jgi:hypothetical protein
MRKIYVVLLSLACTAFAFGQVAPERLLIPLNYNGPGAYGAVWHTVAAISNLSNADSNAAPYAFRTPCVADPNGCQDAILPAGSYATVDTNAPHGVIIGRSLAGDVKGHIYATVHIAAEPLDPRTEGTELPVARENDFTTSVVIPNVPTTQSAGRPVRTLLRVYAIDTGFLSANVFITVYPSSSPNAALGGKQITLRRSSALAFVEPAYAEVDTAEFASVGPYVNLVIESLRTNLNDPFKLWGFVTVTDDATNHITTITPR